MSVYAEHLFLWELVPERLGFVSLKYPRKPRVERVQNLRDRVSDSDITENKP